MSEEGEEASTLQRSGRSSWLLLGIVALASIAYAALAALSGIVVSLVIATVLGMLGVTLVDELERRRFPAASEQYSYS